VTPGVKSFKQGFAIEPIKGWTCPKYSGRNPKETSLRDALRYRVGGKEAGAPITGGWKGGSQEGEDPSVHPGNAWISEGIEKG